MRPLPSAASAVVCASLLAACGGEGVRYDLNLTPIVPPNQDPFAGLDRLELTVEPTRGQPQTYTLDGVSGTPQVTGLEALEEVRVAVRGYAGDTLVSFGRTQTVSISKGSQAVELLFAEVDTFGWLDVLPVEAAQTAAAPDGLGGFWVFGGVDNVYPGRFEALDTVYYLPMAPPSPTLAFTASEAALPEFTGFVDGESYTGRNGHTATLLTGSAPGAGKIFIAGGSSGYVELQATTDQVLLFDPATQTFEELAPLTIPRTNHLAVESQSGDVVVLGGLKYADEDLIETTNVIEVYSRSAGAWTVLEDRLPLGGYFGAAVSLGPEGVLHCGGANLADPWKATDECVLVRSSYEVDEVAPMPEPVARLAMAVTGSGKVLASGGLAVDSADNVGIFDAVEATDGAWLYDPAVDEWTEVGPMAMPRAWHVSSSLPNGDVLIAGGTGASSLFYADDVDDSGPALACVEVFSEEGGLSLLDGCSPNDTTSTLPASAVQPALAYDPLFGVLLVGGANINSGGLSTAALWVSSP